MEQFVTPTSFQDLSLACTELLTPQKQDDHHQFLYSIPNPHYTINSNYIAQYSAQAFGHDPTAAWSDSSMSISSDDEAGNVSPILNNGDDLISMLPGILEYQSMDALMPTIDPMSTLPTDFNASTSYAPPTSQCVVETLNMPITLSSPNSTRPSVMEECATAAFVNETPFSLSNDTVKEERRPSVTSKVLPARKSSTKKQSRRKSSVSTAEIIKRFPCSLCQRSFARNHDLHRHMRVHTGDKPYVCPCCSKGFARTDALKRHFKVEETCRISPQVQNMKTGRRHSTV
ncbi:hypothetical protein INT44_005157 [Umbelopsis vinacea]|uniref:C2H2-type domain-containing protein n=2 Tax=Umbelopsis TaxID=64561 RepID=A0A8H7Q940_9FUNG|nr:hypothetical protein INT44_005157 [Umbelopsis vinacea]